MSAELQRRALRLLARREHTRAELARKLASDAGTNPALQALLQSLEARGLISEERYAEARAHQLSRKFGALRVRRELVAKGIAPEIAARFTADLRKNEIERASSILARKYKNAAASPRERAQRMRFLYARGFSEEVIRAALAASSTDTE
ncbi:MAG TPA: regulatory protein RecX [Burkholderiales bacterium]|nr:regulatory protein RecX [Burkholderiales bacterium]